MRAQKVAILTELMDFTEAEDKAFWPIYRAYETELSAINDERVNGIEEYARSYGKVTDALADKLATKALQLEGRRTALKQKYFTQLKTSALSDDRRAVSPDRKPAPVDHRPADRRIAADRAMSEVGTMTTMHTRRVRSLIVMLMLAGAVVSADRVRLRSGKVD